MKQLGFEKVEVVVEALCMLPKRPHIARMPGNVNVSAHRKGGTAQADGGVGCSKCRYRGCKVCRTKPSTPPKTDDGQLEQPKLEPKPAR